MNICMVGAGYVGLVTGACLAETGHDVVCVDADEAKVAAANRGVSPIFEPGLEEIVRRNLAAGRLRFVTDLPSAIGDALAVFVAVGTPSRRDGGADLSAVDEVALTVAEHARRECVLVLKSTVPVGTNARVRRLVRDAAVKIHVVSNPEFLKEGAAVSDFMRPDRIVVGIHDGEAFPRRVIERLYHPVTLQQSRIVWMSPESAELTKYVANTMLAMRISFMNEIAALCERVGADIHQVRKGVGSDSRIGSKFLYAGPGYGGSCFPKDVQALVHTGHDYGVELELAAATHRVNERQRGVLTRKLRAKFEDDLRGKRVAIWGTAFKPSTDDVRESPALMLIENLLAEGARVVAHDPQALDRTREVFGDRIEYAQDPYKAAEGADALVLVTEWRPYQNPDFERLASILARPLLIDGRNIWTAYHPSEMGFEYEGIGTHG
ncbi:MAG: UDP-glucose/GDP-mannose dehydrogenase family protein [Myxococcales bacterium]|nr:UDP-glucose/GDP-mannose dehydrogenase family protein [Myxococcales bacterium]